MKYLIFAVALLSVANSQACMNYACNSIGDPTLCVANTTAAIANVNTCPTGQMCPFPGFKTIPTTNYIGNLTCQNISSTKPTTLSNIPPGNVCNLTNNDSCNGAATCKNSVCQSKVTLGGNCSSTIECPVGAYCNATTSGVCTANVAPGGNCSASKTQSIT